MYVPNTHIDRYKSTNINPQYKYIYIYSSYLAVAHLVCSSAGRPPPRPSPCRSHWPPPRCCGTEARRCVPYTQTVTLQYRYSIGTGIDTLYSDSVSIVTNQTANNHMPIKPKYMTYQTNKTQMLLINSCLTEESRRYEGHYRIELVQVVLNRSS